MVGGDQTGDNRHKDFNESVSQEQLQAAIENAQNRMNEAIRKAVTDLLIELNFGNSMERLDKRISTQTNKVTELETLVAVNNDVYVRQHRWSLARRHVHDATGNIDRALFLFCPLLQSQFKKLV